MTLYEFTLAYRAADSLAAWVLRDAKDKQGQPIIDHCRRVADLCDGLSREQRIAALLHDVCESTYDDVSTVYVPGTLIGNLFGAEVKQMVDALTRRASEEYMDYIRSIPATCPAAVPIKLADLTDNLDESRDPIAGKLRKRYEKARDYLMSTVLSR